MGQGAWHTVVGITEDTDVSGSITVQDCDDLRPWLTDRAELAHLGGLSGGQFRIRARLGPPGGRLYRAGIELLRATAANHSALRLGMRRCVPYSVNTRPNRFE